MRRTTTIIIGAGQAGLAMSHCLTEQNIDHVVLERGQVANSWRTERWDSLRLLTPNWHSQTWMKKHQLFFEQIRNERAMMYFVLFFIVIVAAFSIMNTMITVTVQKRKEIGVMKALGAREKQIVWVFLAQGMVVGVIGTLVGLAAGNLVIEFREPLRQGLKAAFGMNIFPEGLYGVAEIPERRRLLDMGIICVGAFVLCTLAALVPAWFAARLDPAKALRE